MTFLCIRVLGVSRFVSIAIIFIQLSSVAKVVVDSIFKDIGLDAYIYPVVFKCLM